MDRNNCTSRCGDGMRSALEACDDGNLQDGDGCSADCELEEAADLGGVWECVGVNGSGTDMLVTNAGDLLRTFASAEEADAASISLCRRDDCAKVEGFSAAAAERTARIVSTAVGTTIAAVTSSVVVSSVASSAAGAAGGAASAAGRTRSPGRPPFPAFRADRPAALAATFVTCMILCEGGGMRVSVYISWSL